MEREREREREKEREIEIERERERKSEREIQTEKRERKKEKKERNKAREGEKIRESFYITKGLSSQYLYILYPAIINVCFFKNIFSLLSYKICMDAHLEHRAHILKYVKLRKMLKVVSIDEFFQ